jgi:hypothetical protein
MAIEGIRSAVEAAIQKASQATGVDFSFLMKTANRESGLNPSAKSGSSSAAGLFQFVEQSWLSTLKQYGTKHGYGQYADAITKGSDGRYHVSGQGVRQAVMNLRLDPHASSMMAGEMASDAAAYLKGRTGRDPTAGELYAAHFLGAQGSARLIEAVQSRPGAAAAQIFPDAAHANRSIFYKDGRSATVSEVYANLTKTGGGGVVAAPQPAQGDFIHTASSQGDGRQQRQEALIALVLQGAQPSDAMSAGGHLTGSMFTSEMLKVLSEARNS